MEDLPHCESVTVAMIPNKQCKVHYIHVHVHAMQSTLYTFNPLFNASTL